MKTSVNAGSATNCPTCARPLPAGAPAGLCPACLLAQGTETESGAGGSRTRFEPPSLAAIAALFPQLEILRLLGAGGMGAVYQARQPALDRFVALKVLPADADGGANFTERFNREARALARLNHPHIVTVHEFGQAGVLNYFLMEFVDGANLRQLEQAGRLSPREALQIIPQICDALQYAHDEGVVHRDIKPENVLVDRKGRVKIADFGLAKILGHNSEAVRLTVEGQVMGTPHYMAPEQVERPLAVDHRADIYALGVVFYEMLTGDLPLGKFAPPSRKVQVDVRLDEIVLRALENDPARRYQQASEVKRRVATVVETPAEAKVSAPAADDADENVPKPGVRYLRWLGIPVVVERNGARAVTFQGAIGLSLVMLLAIALTERAVRWVPGTEHAAALFELVTSTLVVIWAMWRTTSQPSGVEPRRGAGGTVFLSPAPRRRHLLNALLVIGLVAFTLGSHYGITAWRGGTADRWPVILGSLALATVALTMLRRLFEAPFGRRALELLLVVGHIACAIAFFSTRTTTLAPDGAGAISRTIGALAPWYRLSSGPGGGSHVDLASGSVWFAGVGFLLLFFICRLQPVKPDRLTRDPAIIVPLLWLLAAVFGVMQPLPKGDFTGSAVAPNPLAANLDSQTGTLRFALPDRGLIELLAVAPVGAVPNAWWRPDGRPLADSSVEVAGLNLTEVPAGKTLYEFVFRSRSLPAGAEVAEINPRAGSAVRGGSVRLDGTPLADAIRVRADLPKSAREATFEAGLGLDPWQTLARHDPAKQTHIRFRQSGEPAWDVALEHRQTTNGLAEVTGTFGPHTQGWQVRLVALDHDGVIHPEVTTLSRHGKDALTSTWTFRSLPLSEVAEFQLQARPLRWVTFSGVTLRPAPAVEPTLRFSAPRLLTVDEVLDLDLGHTAAFPPAPRDHNPLAGMAENMAWALEQGFDVSSGIGEWDLLSLTLVPISPADWESLTPQEAESRLVAQGTKPRTLKLEPEHTPAYAYRTRDGGLGLLRIVELTDNGQHSVIQLRHAVWTDEGPRVLRAKLDPESHVQVARLPGTGSLELLALRPAGAPSWWRPDGQRANGLPLGVGADLEANLPTNSTVGGRFWQLVLRGSQLPVPTEALQLDYQPRPMFRHFTGGIIPPSEGPHPGIGALHVLWPDDLRYATLRVEVPMESWHTIGSYEPLSGSRGRTGRGNDPRWNLELHAAGVGTRGAQITVVLGTNYPGWNFRALATRLGGPAETGLPGASATNGSSVTRTFVFPQFKTLDAVQNFQVQAQPVQWVEFKDLRLPPLDRPAQP